MPVLPARLQPFAKAVTPFVLTLIAIGAQWIVTGDYSDAELATTLTGLAAAIVTFVVPNGAAISHHAGQPPDDDGHTTLGTPVDETYPES